MKTPGTRSGALENHEEGSRGRSFRAVLRKLAALFRAPSRKLAAAFLALVLVLTAFGCGKVPSGSDPGGGSGSASEGSSSGEAGGQGSSSGAAGGQSSSVVISFSDFSYDPPLVTGPRYYAVKNPVKFSYESEKAPTVSGLKDKAVQEKINAALKDYCDMLKDSSFIAPVKGIMIYERANHKRTSVYAYERCNQDNILSVMFMYEAQYYDKSSDDSTWIAYQSALNFDLATGEILKLRDVFADGVDPVKYVNSKIVELARSSDAFSERFSLYYPQTQVSLSSDFKGIREDQPFVIVDANRISILTDVYNSDIILASSGAFWVGTGSELGIDISEVQAVGSRFAGEKDLYESSKRTCCLLSIALDSERLDFSPVVREIMDDEEIRLGMFSYFSLMQYPSLSREQNDFLAMKDLDLDRRLEKDFAALKEFISDSTQYSMTFSVTSSAAQLGRYITLSRNYLVRGFRNSGSVNDNYESYTGDHINDLIVLDADTGRRVELSELFAEGTDYREVIADGIMATFRKYGNAGKVDHEELKKYTSAVLYYAESVTLYSEYMYVGIAGDAQQKIRDAFASDFNSELCSDIINTVSYLEYEDLGSENLAIFR